MNITRTHSLTRATHTHTHTTHTNTHKHTHNTHIQSPHIQYHMRVDSTRDAVFHLEIKLRDLVDIIHAGLFHVFLRCSLDHVSHLKPLHLQHSWPKKEQ